MVTPDAPPRYRLVLSPKVRRYAWIVVVGGLVGGLVEHRRAQERPEVFQSAGRMIVSGRVNIPEAQGAYSEELANFAGTQMEIMRSEEVVSRATQRLQLERPELRGQAVLTVGLVPRSSIFELTAQGDEPHYTRVFLDALMREFIEFKRERRLAASQSTVQQISAEIARLEAELAEQEQALFRFREQHNIGYWEQQSAARARYLSELKDREARLRFQLSLLDNWQKLNAEQGGAPEALGPAGLEGAVPAAGQAEIRAARQRVMALQVSYQMLGRGLRPAHPKMRQLHDEIERESELLRLLEEQARELARERQLVLRSELAGLEQAIGEWDGKVVESSRVEAEYQKILSTLERTRQLYNRLVGSLQTLDLSQGMDQELVQILQPATPAEPVGRGVREAVLRGLTFGLMAGAAVFALVVRLDNRTLTTSETVDALRCRQLGEIPRLPSRHASERTRRLRLSAVEEAIRRLRSLLLSQPVIESRPVVLVTSALAGEGKTEISKRLAEAMARTGKRVLLIDADLRRGRLHVAFGLKECPVGLHEFLRGEVESSAVMRPTAEEGLVFVTRGSNTYDASDLFGRSGVSERLERLCADYDFVVIDSAPVGPVDDTNWLLRSVSLILYVVRTGRTPLHLAEAGLEIIRSRSQAEVGLVLNGARVESLGKYYDYYRKTAGS